MKHFIAGFAIAFPLGIAAAHFYYAKAIALGKSVLAHVENDYEKAEKFLVSFKKLFKF